MALPAGRYGVTKNQLLKIKKLPMNTIKLIEELTEKFDLLGTAAFKNSTSVVTDSSDLVESGAVKDIVGWGNKNILPNNANSFTDNGVTFTVNEDGSITINGTATANVFCKIFEDNNHNVSWNGYKLTGCPSGGGNSTYRLDLSNVDATSESDVGDGKEITIDNTGKIIIRIRIANGYAANNVTFYPMISKDGGAYEPYHASVEESLEQKCDNSVIAPVENGSTASQAYAVGEHFIRNGAFCTVTQAISSGGTLTEGTNYTSGDVAELLTSIMSQLGTLRYKMINVGPSTGMLTTDIYTGNQFFALVIMLVGNNIAFAYCGRRYNAGTFVTSDNTILGVSDNGYLQVFGDADSRRYHILYGQN